MSQVAYQWNSYIIAIQRTRIVNMAAWGGIPYLVAAKLLSLHVRSVNWNRNCDVCCLVCINHLANKPYQD